MRARSGPDLPSRQPSQSCHPTCLASPQSWLPPGIPSLPMIIFNRFIIFFNALFDISKSLLKLMVTGKGAVFGSTPALRAMFTATNKMSPTSSLIFCWWMQLAVGSASSSAVSSCSLSAAGQIRPVEANPRRVSAVSVPAASVTGRRQRRPARRSCPWQHALRP